MKVPPSSDGGLRVDTMQIGFDTVIRGLAVVLGRPRLVDRDSPTAASFRSPPIASGSGYWLVTAQTDVEKREVTAFRRWPTSERRRADHAPPPAQLSRITAPPS